RAGSGADAVDAAGVCAVAEAVRTDAPGVDTEAGAEGAGSEELEAGAGDRRAGSGADAVDAAGVCAVAEAVRTDASGVDTEAGAEGAGSEGAGVGRGGSSRSSVSAHVGMRKAVAR
ncbi:hypothetical protein L0F81_43120, partial [Streptomyces tricolor]